MDTIQRRYIGWHGFLRLSPKVLSN